MKKITLFAYVSLIGLSPLVAAEKSWNKDTALVSPAGTETVVRAFQGDAELYKNADPQLAIEWAMKQARITLVLAGKYMTADRIDIPRDGVTLIIDHGAEIMLNGDTEHTSVTPGFRGWDGTLHHHDAVIYNKGHDKVTVMQFGTLIGPGPIFFDGRNEERTCGIEGGMIVATGSFNQQPCSWSIAKGFSFRYLRWANRFLQ